MFSKVQHRKQKQFWNQQVKCNHNPVDAIFHPTCDPNENPPTKGLPEWLLEGLPEGLPKELPKRFAKGYPSGYHYQGLQNKTAPKCSWKDLSTAISVKGFL